MRPEPQVFRVALDTPLRRLFDYLPPASPGAHPPAPGSRVRVVFHPGAVADLGAIAKAEGATRALLVTDPGIVEAGHVERAMRSLYHAGIVTRLHDGVHENPTTDHVHRGLAKVAGAIHGGLYRRIPWFGTDAHDPIPLTYSNDHSAVVLRVGDRPDRMWHFWAASPR